MKTFAAGLATQVAANPQKLAVCWIVRKTDGAYIRGTSHDRDITITDSGFSGKNIEGTYRSQANIIGSDVRSSSDLSVDNVEVSGAFPTGAITDLTVAQVESGVLDMALTTVFLVPWASPDAGIVVLRHGPLGEISRNAEGEYRTEVRGLAQYLQQNVGRTYGQSCDVRTFGDTRCGFNLTAATRTGTVTVATSRRTFSFSLSGSTPATGYFSNGVVTFTSGDNNGFSRSIKTATYSGGVLTVTLFEEMPADVTITNTVSVAPGCDRTWLTCRYVHNNAVNFRGHGVFTPGIAPVIRGAT